MTPPGDDFFECAPTALGVLGVDGTWRGANRMMRRLHENSKAQITAMCPWPRPGEAEGSREVVVADSVGRIRQFLLVTSRVESDDGVPCVVMHATETPADAAGGSHADAFEVRFRALADAAPIGIFEADADGSSRYTNPAWQRITGLSAADAHGNGWTKMLHPDDADEVATRWADNIRSPQAYSIRCRVMVGDEVRWVDAALAPTVLCGHVTGFVGTLVDVTSVIAAERSLADARDRAVEASRLKSEFIANISHEIRTPLNGVLGLAQILSESDLDDRQRGYVQTIRRAGDELLQLLNDVLDLSKIEAGAMRTETVAFDVAVLVRDTVRLYESNAASRGIALDLVISDRIPTRAAGDPTRLRQVLSNLVSNAIKFTDNGTVTVTADATAVTAQDFVLDLAVIDTGVGISPADTTTIFEPFEQGDSSTTRRFGGSGLGLSISKRIVDMLAGRISCESEPGRGSTFAVSIPLALQAAGAVEAETGAVRTLRILVVEDNPVNSLVIQTVLGKLGHTVQLAENGQVAVDLVAAGQPDVVLMDCQMPVMDGYEATAAIRSLPGDAAHVPIVALTASAMPEDKQRCLDAGMDAYLPKPLNQAELVTTLGAVCREPAETTLL